MEELINAIDNNLPDILIYRYELYNESSGIFYTDDYSYETKWPNKYLNYSSITNKLFDTFGYIFGINYLKIPLLKILLFFQK